jgi:hypothetical protein
MKSQLGFYLWAYNNSESVDYILGKLRNAYPDSDLVLSSDNGKDMSQIAEKYLATKYIHGEKSHGPSYKSLEANRYGWTVNEAKLWLDRLYEACQTITNDWVMLMEEDVLVKERFKFPAVDIIMIPNIKNAICTSGVEWVKSRGGKTNYPWYSAGGGSIINRQKFIEAYEKHIDSFTENYERIYDDSMSQGIGGWGWNDSIICVLMYAENPQISTELPILETGNEDDPAPIIHAFKKYYVKNLILNLVLIPAVTRNPLLSPYLTEDERLEQLCKSVKTAINKIPNPYIIILEGGTQNTQDDTVLLNNGANAIFHYDLVKNGKRLQDPNRSKSYGEMTLFIEFFNSSKFKELRPSVKSISKLGGRAFLNESFVFDDSDNSVIRWQPVSWSGKGNCSQRYWKVSASKIDYVITKYNEMLKRFNEVIDIEHGFYQFNVIPFEGIEPNINEGVTHFVSPLNIWENT